eukprot:TRINITY_DN28553_c0_g1_i1.p1 TRINITY_DN28553_c0_g1~~TRINITY_DN28553_c0_g1_i1.p1  ORF type:complete len:1001 (+),score=378.89 TRINITY_DN28553_c0_g1_i1:159-3161(+)
MHEISDAEFNNYVRMFKTYDTDGSGTIDLWELGEVMRCLGVTLTQEQLSDLMRSVDVDASGEIEFNEFLLLMVQHKESQAFRILQKSAQTMEHVRSAMSSKMLLPDERWRWLYDLLMFSGVIYYSAMVCYATLSLAPCRELETQNELHCYPSTVMLPLEILYSVLFVIDVPISFRTAYIDANGVLLVEDERKIMRHYLRTSFVPDAIAALPLDLLVGLTTGSPREYLMMYSLRLFKVARLPHLFGTTFRGSMDGQYVSFHFKFVPMLKQTAAMLFSVHVLTCLWMRVQDPSAGSKVTYVQALYLVLYTITTVGYGDMAPVTDWERLYTCFLFLAGLVMNAFVVGKMAATLQKGDIKSERKARMTETLAVLQHFEIPLVLQCEILAFQHHILEHDLSSSYSEVVSSLPHSMQDSLGLYIRVKFIMMVPLFSKIGQEVQVALAQSLKNIVVAPEEFIIVKGEEGKEMFFVGHGFADVISPAGDWLVTVKKGAFIGEVALLVQCDRTASVKALTYCDLFRLDRSDFTSIVKRFPSFQEEVQREIDRRFGSQRPGGQTSDNSPSSCAQSLRSSATGDNTQVMTVYKSIGQANVTEVSGDSRAMADLDTAVQSLLGSDGSVPLAQWSQDVAMEREVRLGDGQVAMVRITKGEPRGKPIECPPQGTLTIRGRELKVISDETGKDLQPRARQQQVSDVETPENSRLPIPQRATLQDKLASQNSVTNAHRPPTPPGPPPLGLNVASWRGHREVTLQSENDDECEHSTSLMGQSGSSPSKSIRTPRSPRRSHSRSACARAVYRSKRALLGRSGWWVWAQKKMGTNTQLLRSLLRAAGRLEESLDDLRAQNTARGTSLRPPAGGAPPRQRVSIATSHVSRLSSDSVSSSFSLVQRRASVSIVPNVSNPVRSGAATARGSIFGGGGGGRSLVRGAGKVAIPTLPTRRVPVPKFQSKDSPVADRERDHEDALPGHVNDPLSSSVLRHPMERSLARSRPGGSAYDDDLVSGLE